jgi:hypothetical protein
MSDALCAGISCGHLVFVRALLADGRADPAVADSEGLVTAARRGHAGIVRALLADGRANPAARNSRALRIASVKEHAHVVRALLADGRSDPEDVRDLWVGSLRTDACLLLRTAARWRRRRPWLLCAAKHTAPGK